MENFFALGVSLGLINALHCIGMCGAFMWILPFARNNSVYQFTIYHLGRVSMYILLGGLIGLVGESIKLITSQQFLSVFSGVVLILTIVVSNSKTRILNRLPVKFTFIFNSFYSRFLKAKNIGAFFILGVINGLLPCGVVYWALITSLAFGSIIKSALFMAAFGLSTFLIFSLLFWIRKSALQTSLMKNNRLSFITPYFSILVAGLLILRGLGLGIPFVSPKLNSLSNEGIKNKTYCHPGY